MPVEPQGEIPPLQALKQLHATEAVCEHRRIDSTRDSRISLESLSNAR